MKRSWIRFLVEVVKLAVAFFTGDLIDPLL